MCAWTAPGCPRSLVYPSCSNANNGGMPDAAILKRTTKVSMPSNPRTSRLLCRNAIRRCLGTTCAYCPRIHNASMRLSIHRTTKSQHDQKWKKGRGDHPNNINTDLDIWQRIKLPQDYREARGRHREISKRGKKALAE